MLAEQLNNPGPPDGLLALPVAVHRGAPGDGERMVQAHAAGPPSVHPVPAVHDADRGREAFRSSMEIILIRRRCQLRQAIIRNLRSKEREIQGIKAIDSYKIFCDFINDRLARTDLAPRLERCDAPGVEQREAQRVLAAAGVGLVDVANQRDEAWLGAYSNLSSNKHSK